MQYPADNDIYIAAKTCRDIIACAVNDLSPVPCPHPCITQAITMLSVAHECTESIMSMALAMYDDDHDDTDGSTITPPAASA